MRPSRSAASRRSTGVARVDSAERTSASYANTRRSGQFTIGWNSMCMRARALSKRASSATRSPSHLPSAPIAASASRLSWARRNSLIAFLTVSVSSPSVIGLMR